MHCSTTDDYSTGRFKVRSLSIPTVYHIISTSERIWSALYCINTTTNSITYGDDCNKSRQASSSLAHVSSDSYIPETSGGGEVPSGTWRGCLWTSQAALTSISKTVSPPRCKHGPRWQRCKHSLENIQKAQNIKSITTIMQYLQ